MIITNPNQLKAVMKDCYDNKLPLFIFGNIGVGKSQIVKQFHDEYVGGIFIDERASELDVTDLRGLFRISDSGTEFVPPKQYMDLTKEGVSGTLFLDEFNLAPEDVQKIMYKIILDRKVQQYTLSDKVFVVAAGNSQDEVSIVNEMSPALINRFVIVRYNPNPQHIIDYLVAKYKPIPEIESFLNEYKNNLVEEVNFEQIQFARPRNYERVIAYLKNKTVNDIIKDEHTQTMIYCILGTKMGKNLINSVILYKELNIEELSRNPKMVKGMKRENFFPLVYKVVNKIVGETKNIQANIAKYSPVVGEIPDAEFHLLFVKNILNVNDGDVKKEIYQTLVASNNFPWINSVLKKVIESQK